MAASRPRPFLWVFVLAMVVAGAAALVQATASIRTPVDPRILVVAAFTLASGRFKIKMPGHPAVVSVSEVFVFASVLLFGPAPATITAAVDGLWASLTQNKRRLHRTLFNVAEPVVSTWIAGRVFFALAQGVPAGGVAAVLPAVGMSAAYFILNSGLTALAVAIENGGSAFSIWRQHALYLGINDYAAASLAMLIVRTPMGVDLGVIGLVIPLLVLSYVAYKTAANRLEDADKHLHEVERLYKATVETLAIAVDAKDQVTHGHIRRVQRYTLELARALNVTGDTELKALEAASLLHDIGKLVAPDYVLNKPGALSPGEFNRIMQHASKGADILSAVEFPYPVVPIVRHHHEQWDGRGYPDGLAGRDIPLGARILTVVDCFDALTSDRPYRRKLADSAAIDILRKRSGSMYDPDCVDAFIAMVPTLRRQDAVIEAAGVAPLPVQPPAPRLPVRPGESTIAPPAPASSLDNALFDLVGPRFSESLARVLPGTEFCLFVPDASGDELFPVWASKALCPDVLSLRLPIGAGVSGWVAANRHTIVNSPADLDLGELAARVGLRACVSTVAFALSQLACILTVYSPAAEGLSSRDVRLVGALAQEIGLEISKHETRRLDRVEAPWSVARSTA